MIKLTEAAQFAAKKERLVGDLMYDAMVFHKVYRSWWGYFMHDVTIMAGLDKIKYLTEDEGFSTEIRGLEKNIFT